MSNGQLPTNLEVPRGVQESGSMRAFVAIRIVGRAAQGLGMPWKNPMGLPVSVFDTVEWERAGFHITLRFLGDVTSERVKRLIASMPDDKLPPRFALTLGSKLGVFPDQFVESSPRILWVGVEGDLQALYDVQSLVEAAAQSVGLPPSDYPFTPHITLGRFRNMTPEEARQVRRAVPKVLGYPLPVSGKVGSISLLHSVRETNMMGDGTHIAYRTVHSFDLRSEGGSNADRPL